MTRPTFTALATVTIVFVADLGAGCAAAPPAVASDDEGPTASNTLVGAIVAAPTAAQPVRCVPGAPRACKIYWTDTDHGIHHCTESVQVCRGNGVTWTDCGDLDAGVLPDASDDAGASPELVTDG